MDPGLIPPLEYTGWSDEHYQKALREFELSPPEMPDESEEDYEYHSKKLLTALKKLGIEEDFQTLLDNDVYSRQQLVLLKKKNLEELKLKGTLEQYKSMWEPAMDECPTDGESYNI